MTSGELLENHPKIIEKMENMYLIVFIYMESCFLCLVSFSFLWPLHSTLDHLLPCIDQLWEKFYIFGMWWGWGVRDCAVMTEYKDLVYSKLYQGVSAMKYHIMRLNDVLRTLMRQTSQCCHFRPKIWFWRFFDLWKHHLSASERRKFFGLSSKC